MPNDGVPPRKRGCIFYGCLSLVILGLLGLAGVYVAYRVTLHFVAKAVETYTDTAPVPLDIVSYAPEERQALQARIDTFMKRHPEGGDQDELVLSADDLNALIAQEQTLKGRFFVLIEGDRIKGKVSFPLRDLWKLKLNGRYLNGTASFKASLAGGRLNVTLDDVQVKGRLLPEVLLRELKKENLAKDLENDPQIRETIARFESIEVRDGKVVFKTKPKPVERPQP